MSEGQNWQMGQTETVDAARDVTQVARVICQVVGMILIAVGAYYLIKVLGEVLKFFADPAHFAPHVEAIGKIIQADQIVIRAESGNVALGGTVATVITICWYLIAVWIPLSILATGGRIVAWNVDERRQIKMILQQFLGSIKEVNRS